MKKLILALTLLSSLNSFSLEMASDAEIDHAIASATFSSNLWYCNSEKALKELSDSFEIKNNLGCKKAIQRAKQVLDTSEVKRILEKHVRDLQMIQKFEVEVKDNEDFTKLSNSVISLKEKGLSLNLIKRNINLSEEEMLAVELSFERNKSNLERALEDL